MKPIWDRGPVVIARWLDLDDEKLASLGWGTHPTGRYVNLDDIRFIYATGAMELGDLIRTVEEDQ